jgi:hypothetical protein
VMGLVDSFASQTRGSLVPTTVLPRSVARAATQVYTTYPAVCLNSFDV